MGLLGLFVGKLLDMIGLKFLVIFGIVVMIYVIWELIKLNMDMLYMIIMGIYVLCLFGMVFIMMLMVIVVINVLLGWFVFYGNVFLNMMC